MSNRLSTEPSRYLRQHAGNPVEWYPWSDEAFELARNEDKPLFVSIGYSSCHWCHVMAHESFEDPDVAGVINEKFVPIKVDKEEYPDVDGYYMSFLAQLSGQGGWPLNVFLNPNRAPFYGFTYLPKERLKSILEYVHSEYMKNEAMKTQEIGSEFTQKAVDKDEVKRLVSGISIESPHTDSGPQFPQPLYLILALEKNRTDLVTAELENLICKGLFDQIEGGWFRYSVDPSWKIPHFEKMLYDQATLLLLCGRAYKAAPELCSYAMQKSIAWLSNRMRLRNGLYGSATDADTEEGEGHYYTFEPNKTSGGDSGDSDALTGEELFRLDECGSHGGRDLPWLDFEAYRNDPEAAESLIAARREERDGRSVPGLDDKAVFSWNAFLAYAFYECCEATGDEAYRILGDGLLTELRSHAQESIPHVVYQSGETKGNTYLEDYAAYLLALSAASRYDEKLTAEVQSSIEDAAGRFLHDGGLRHTNKLELENQSLWQDSPFPSGGSMLLNALAKTGNTDGALFEAFFTQIAEVSTQHPVFFANWCLGFTRYFES